jgi:hypothetical protein
LSNSPIFGILAHENSSTAKIPSHLKGKVQRSNCYDHTTALAAKDGMRIDQLDGLRATSQSSSDFSIHTTLPLPAKIGQIDGLQILRAVAVFLVAWLHAGQQLGDWRVAELPHFAAFGIDIFFVISGFIMSSVLLRTRQSPGIGAT